MVKELAVPERIETGRLILRRFTEGDRSEMVRFYGDADVMAIRKYGARDADAASAAFDILMEHWCRYGFGLYAVIERGSGAFCGECGLRYTDDGAEVEISYGLFAPFRGKGYATEGASVIRDVAIDVLKLPVLVARSRGDNRGSHAVLEKIGMTFAGRQESHAHDHGVVKYVLDLDSGS